MERGIFIGIGSNLSDPELQVRKAFDRLAELGVVTQSPCYRSAPWGDTEQDEFVNAVAGLATTLAPRALMQVLKAIETEAGRTRTRRWGPRVLDLDLLAYDQQRIDDSDLVVPHPHLAERAFVLIPWADVAADFEVPRMGRVADLLERCPGRDSVTLLDGNP